MTPAEIRELAKRLETVECIGDTAALLDALAELIEAPTDERAFEVLEQVKQL